MNVKKLGISHPMQWCVVFLLIVISSYCCMPSIANPVVPVQGRHSSLPARPSWKTDPSLAVLNVWYIRIATAVAKNDKKSLSNYAQEMQIFATSRDKPYLHLPALRARTFILSRLDDRESFLKSFAALCRIAKDSTDNQMTVIKFAKEILPWLQDHKKSAWAVGAEQAGRSSAGPDPDDLYMFFLQRRLKDLKDPKARIRLLRLSISNADHAITRLKNEASSAQRGQQTVSATQPGDAVSKLTKYKQTLKQLRVALTWQIHHG